jgi:hypothetical protein
VHCPSVLQTECNVHYYSIFVLSSLPVFTFLQEEAGSPYKILESYNNPFWDFRYRVESGYIPGRVWLYLWNENSGLHKLLALCSDQLPKILAYLSCSVGCMHFARTNNLVSTVYCQQHFINFQLVNRKVCLIFNRFNID